MATVDVTEASFDKDVLASNEPVLVDFWAQWCAPCRMIAPALDEIATELAGKIIIAKINIDDEPGLADRFGVRSIPTMMIFKGGEVVASKLGAEPKNALKGWIEGAI